MPVKPYVILCSGQSNMARITPGIHWNPPTNLRVWGYSVRKHSEGVGDSFAVPAADIGNYANFYGAAIAKNHPERDVYIINISKGGTNLSQWLPDAASVNMMRAVKANVSAAMKEIPLASTIDEIIWWGHESDAVPDAYVTSDRFIEMFENVIDEIDAQSWVAETKPPIRMHRLHPNSNRLASQINHALECLVRRHPQRIRLSDTTQFSYADDIHLDPQVKEAAANQVLMEPELDACALPRSPQVNLLRNGDFSDQAADQDSQHSTTDQNTRHGQVPSISERARISSFLYPWIAEGTGEQVQVHDGVVNLNGDGILVQKIPKGDLKNKVVTLSGENIKHDLKVQIGKHTAYIYAGEGRRQASFALHSTFKNKLRIALAPVDGKSASISKIKLEYGGAATDYTHSPAPKGVRGAIDRGLRRLKQR